MDILKAKESLDNLIKKARVHLYKPIQVAEILYRDRVVGDITLSKLETYRNASKRWRDVICNRFVGRTSTSSARYQDDVFNENATSPNVLDRLGKENRKHNGIVEAYIYRCFEKRLLQVSSGLEYCLTHTTHTFNLKEFIDLFWYDKGLRRSVDKIYEIIVYALFESLVKSLNVHVTISTDPTKLKILEEFEDFAIKVIGISVSEPSRTLKARINRVGVTNAADRGLDMWANFGMAIQIKHLSLTEELAENIVTSISSDRIVIVCKNSEQKLIVSILNQLGWKSRIQSIITENDLIKWYDKALKGDYSSIMGEMILDTIKEQIQLEFPSADSRDFMDFISERKYDKLVFPPLWQPK